MKKQRQWQKAVTGFFFKDNKFPSNYWFNAVLLRGYVELYKVYPDEKYIDAFKEYVSYIWEKERDRNNIVGKDKSLIDQAAYVEMLTRLNGFK